MSIISDKKYLSLEQVIEQVSNSYFFDKTETLKKTGFVLHTSKIDYTWVLASSEWIYFIVDCLEYNGEIKLLMRIPVKEFTAENYFSLTPIETSVRSAFELKFTNSPKTSYCTQSLFPNEKSLHQQFQKLINS